MVKFLYEIVRDLKRKGKKYWKVIYKINKIIVNILFPIVCRWRHKSGICTDSKVIVSLTTHPMRIKTVWITIASLLQQTVKPHLIILWLAEEQFPEKKLPKSLLRLQKRGLQICFCEDLKPHKKYFYAMLKYPKYYIVTADDDIFYPEDHIERLWEAHKLYPTAIICHWSHRIEFDETGQFTPYNSWEDNGKETPSYRTLAIGCNGILYPPGSIPKNAFVKENIMKEALFTDDLWLKCMEILNGRKTLNCNDTVLIYFNILSAQKSGLWKKNTDGEKNNDRVWNRLTQLYPEVKDKLIEEKEYD